MTTSTPLPFGCPSLPVARSTVAGWILALALTVSGAGPLIAQVERSHRRALASATGDSVAATRTVESFREALARGDSTGALALLAPDVIILESGEMQRFDDYRSHHLGADIAFARAVPSTHTLVSLRVEGNTSWVTSTSATQGQFNGRAVNSAGAELIVLTRGARGGAWRIRAVHWSSHRKPT